VIHYKEPSHQVCKPAYFMPVPSQDKLGGLCQEGIRCKNGGDGRDGAPNDFGEDLLSLLLLIWFFLLLLLLEGVSGKVIGVKKGIKDSWKEYMEKLMNEENEWDHRISAGVKEGPADCIRIDEVATASKKMKRHKAPGLSGLVAEMIQVIGDIGTQWILDLSSRLHSSQRTSGHFSRSLTWILLIPRTTVRS